MADNPSNAPEGQPEKTQSNQQNEVSSFNQKEPFDAIKAFAELTAGDADGPGRKLTFFDQCAALALTQSHIKPWIIAKAFGITKVTVSHIAGCTKNNNRYRRVAQEWRALGQLAFDRKYYTEELHIQVAKVKYDVDGARTRLDRTAPSRLADKKSFRTIGAFPINDEFWRVDWRQWKDFPKQNGWYFSYCKADGTPIEGETKLRAYGAEQPDADPIPFRTSGYAYNAAFAFVGAPIPRP